MKNNNFLDDLVYIKKGEKFNIGPLKFNEFNNNYTNK